MTTKTRIKWLWNLKPFSTICQLFHGGQFYWWRKLEYPKKTTDLSKGTDKLWSHNNGSSTPHLSGIRTYNTSGDYTDSCRPNYHTITATSIPQLLYTVYIRINMHVDTFLYYTSCHCCIINSHWRECWTLCSFHGQHNYNNIMKIILTKYL